MSTKNEKYPFIEQIFTTPENQYYNLNLNQGKKCSILVAVQSNSKPNNDKYCGKKIAAAVQKKIKSSKINFYVEIYFGTAATNFIVSDNFEEKQKLQSWDKSSKASSFITFNEDNLKKRWKNGNTLKITNKSTLSLHIEAYENSFEAAASDLFDDENTVGLKKEKFGSIKTSKQCFTNSLKFRNPFEFPRQQTGDQRNKPEIMQFKASQELLLLAEDLTAQTPPATTTELSGEKLIQENWWILVVGIILMIVVGAGLLFLGYKCSGENRTRKSEKESRRVTTLE